MSLPAKFREAFVDGAWLTVGQDGCLFAFPRAEWERRSEEVASFPLSDSDGRAYARLFFGSSDEAKLDGQGRLTIPQRLREAVGHRQGRRGARRAGPDGDLGPGDVRALQRPVRGRVPGRCARSEEVERRGRRTETSEPNKLGAEVRQSLSLIGMTALTLVASIGVGLLVGQLG